MELETGFFAPKSKEEEKVLPPQMSIPQEESIPLTPQEKNIVVHVAQENLSSPAEIPKTLTETEQDVSRRARVSGLLPKEKRPFSKRAYEKAENIKNWGEMIKKFEELVILLENAKNIDEEGDAQLKGMVEKAINEFILALQPIPFDSKDPDGVAVIENLLLTLLQYERWPGEELRDEKMAFLTSHFRRAYSYIVGWASTKHFPEINTGMKTKTRSEDRKKLEGILEDVQMRKLNARRMFVIGAATGAVFGISGLAAIKGTYNFFVREKDFEELQKECTIENRGRKVKVFLPEEYTLDKNASLFWGQQKPYERYGKVHSLDGENSFMIPDDILGEVKITVQIPFGGSDATILKTQIVNVGS